MKLILLAGLLAGVVGHAEVAVQNSTVTKLVPSGAATEVNPRQRAGFYSLIMTIGSKVTLGTYTEITRYDRDGERGPLFTVGPQIDYQLGEGTAIAFIRPAKDLGDELAPQKVGRISLTAGISLGEADLKKAIKKGFRKVFH